jgi:hypothetical protein
MATLHRIGFMSADFHPNHLRYPCSSHVANCCSTKVMEFKIRHSGFLQAFAHNIRKSIICLSSRLKSQGESGRCSSRSFLAAKRKSLISPSKMGTVRPSPVLVLSGFKFIRLVSKSTGLLFPSPLENREPHSLWEGCVFAHCERRFE